MDNRTLNNAWNNDTFISNFYDVKSNWIYTDDTTSTSNKIK